MFLKLAGATPTVLPIDDLGATRLVAKTAGPDPRDQAEPDAGQPLLMLDCQTACQLVLPTQQVNLHAGDLVLMRGQSAVTVQPAPEETAFALRLFAVDAPASGDFGPNDLIAGLLATTHGAHIVFRRINHALVTGYCDQLAELAQVQPQDAILRYEFGAVAHLLLTELSRSGLYAMMIIESDFPDAAVHHAPTTQQKAIILNYLMANLATATLATTADHFGYEHNYFSRLFTRLFGQSFTKEVRFVRLNQAKKLLELSQKSVGAVASAVGYNDPANFNRHFKQLTGMVPSAYRAAHRPH